MCMGSGRLDVYGEYILWEESERLDAYGEYILWEESERLDVYGEWEIRLLWRVRD